MNLILKINLRRMTNSVFFIFMRAILEFFNIVGAGVVKVTDEFAKLQSEVANLETQFDNDQGSDITDELLTLDAERDDAFTGIRDFLKAMMKHFDPKKRKAAQKLFSNLSSHGTDVNTTALNAETGVLVKMLNEWDTNADLKAAITDLGIGDWVAYLKLKNQTFETKYQSRDQEAGAKQKEGMRLARAATMDAYKKLMIMFESQYNVNKGVPPFAKLLQDINGAIDKQNDLLNHGGNSDNGPTPPPTPQ